MREVGRDEIMASIMQDRDEEVSSSSSEGRAKGLSAADESKYKTTGLKIKDTTLSIPKEK